MKHLALSVLTVISVSAFGQASATTIDVEGIFPGSCRATVATKASKILNAEISREEGSYLIKFDLALFMCLAGGSQFDPYPAHPREFIELYDLFGTFDLVRMHLLDFPQIGNVSQVSLKVPRVLKDGENELNLRMDIYVYRERIPYRIQIIETPNEFRAVMTNAN